MAEIRRLTDSCVQVTTDDAVTLFDPGFHTFLEGVVDLESIGDVTRILVTHEHADHVNPDFIKWLLDRGEDVTVYSNGPVVELLGRHDIEVIEAPPEGTSVEDVLHGRLPTGAQPPNRSWTIEGVITHPGDSREPTRTAPILALPMMAPWDSATGAVEFARRVKPSQVLPIHDFYLSESGRAWIRGMVGNVLAKDGIEVLEVDWGQSFSI